MTKIKIGLYGISGVGKTTLLSSFVSSNAITTIEGSTAIDKVTHGGLDVFKNLSAAEKTILREKAIHYLQEVHRNNKRHTIVGGHYSFPSTEGFNTVWSHADAKFYDIIFYLHKPAHFILNQQVLDKSRIRNNTIEQITNWQFFEISEFSRVCRLEKIPFILLDGTKPDVTLKKKIVHKISKRSIEKEGDKIANESGNFIYVFDCDGTLNKSDIYDYSDNILTNTKTITSIFKKSPRYDFDAFYSVSEYLSQPNVLSALEKTFATANKELTIHPKIMACLENIAKTKGAIILLSCGYPDIWQKKIEIPTYSIGGAIFDRYGTIIDPEIKSILVKHLGALGKIVTCFGNSSSDIPMLLSSNYATYVHHGKPNEDHLDRLRPHKNLSLMQIC